MLLLHEINSQNTDNSEKFSKSWVLLALGPEVLKMCIEVDEEQFDEIGRFAGRCTGWQEAKCGGRWRASVWKGKPSPLGGAARVPMVLLERLHRSNQVEDSIIVSQSELLQMASLRDAKLGFRPHRWVKDRRIVRWIDVPKKPYLCRRDDEERARGDAYVASGLCGPEAAAKWRAESRSDRRPTLNEFLSSRHVRRLDGGLCSYEQQLKERLNRSLQHQDPSRKAMDAQMALDFQEEKRRRGGARVARFDPVPLNWQPVPNSERREYLSVDGVETDVPVLSVVPVTFVGSADRGDFRAVRVRGGKNREVLAANTSAVQLHVWVGDECPARDQYLFLKLKPEFGGAFYAAREVPWAHQEAYWRFLWRAYCHAGQEHYGRCCSSCLLGDARCGDCEPCRTGEWCQHRQCVTTSWRRRCSPPWLLTPNAFKCPPVFRVGANGPDTDAARRRVRRSRQLGQDSSVRIRGFQKVEEVVVDLSPDDISASEFSGGLAMVVDEPAISPPRSDAAPSDTDLGAAVQVCPPGTVEEPPLLPLERPEVPAVVSPRPLESVSFVGSGVDLASMRCCVGLCGPTSTLPASSCADGVLAPRLLVVFRCPEWYCPGLATPGGARGFRGQQCVSVGAVWRHFEAHGYSREEVAQRVKEVLGQEVRRRRASVHHPDLSRMVRCAYPACPSVGSVGQMWVHAQEYHRFTGEGLVDHFYGWNSVVSPRERVAARLVMEEVAGMEIARERKTLQMPVSAGAWTDDGLAEVCVEMRRGTLPDEGFEEVVGWVGAGVVGK